MLNKADVKLLGWFFPLLFFISYLQARAILPPHYYPTTGLLSWPFRVFILYIGVKCFFSSAKRFQPLTFFIIISIVSGCMYLFSGYPINLYVHSIAFYVLPMLMAYVALDKSDTEVFMSSFFWSSIVLFVVGIYLFIFYPAWYANGISEHFNNAWSSDSGSFRSDEWLKEHTRLSSFMLSSYAISYYSIFALPYAYVKFANSRDKKRKLYFIAIVIIIISAFLCQQRVAIAMALMTTFLYIYLKNKKNLFKIFFLVIILVGIGLFIAFQFQDNLLVAMVINRFEEMTLGKAMEGSRTTQIQNVLSAIDNLLLGKGIGSGGGEARRIGLVGATDANYVKMLYEQGLLGLLSFILIGIITLLKGFINIRYLFVETMAVFGILFSMLGADPLTYFFYILPFWYCMGRIWNKNYLITLKMNKIHV